MTPASCRHVGAAALALILFHAASGADSSSSEGLAPFGYANPVPRSWNAPVFPAGLSNTDNGTVVMRIVIDETGSVTSTKITDSSLPDFDAPAIVAVKAWKFDPARIRDQPVACCIEVPIRLSRAADKGAATAAPKPLLMEVSRTAAVLKDAPLGEFPATLQGRGLPGRVVFRCTVQPDGTARNLLVLQTSHADYVVPAVQSSAEWRFAPGKQGDLVVPTDVIGEVYYVEPRTASRRAVLAANHITAPDGSEPEDAPKLLASADPVIPYDLLLRGEGGSAAVEFVVTANGTVRDVRVKEASHPDFGAALVAAVESWVFSGAMRQGRSIDVPLVATATFPAVPLGSPKDTEEWLPRLAALARSGAIAGGTGLDERLTPIYRVAPVPPSSVREAKGEVVVDFIIDRDGRARLPRVAKSANPELGWAAVTAISQWVFKAPTRGAKPTEVRVQIPVGF